MQFSKGSSQVNLRTLEHGFKEFKTNIYLANLDRVLENRIDYQVIKIYNYVDDYFVLLRLTANESLNAVADNIMNSFRSCTSMT